MTSIAGEAIPLYQTRNAISPDGETLVGGSGDKTVRIWELMSGKEQPCHLDFPSLGRDLFPSVT